MTRPPVIKKCRYCETEFRATAKFKYYCSEKCAAIGKRKRNNEASLKHFHANKQPVIKPCKGCLKDIVIYGRQIFCEECSKTRRQEKMREYKKAQRQSKDYQEQERIRRANKRNERKAQDLCIDCGEATYEGLIRCYTCHNDMISRCTKYNRSQGIKEAGGSRHEGIIKSLITSLSEYTFTERDWTVVRNHESNQALQLDFYCKQLQLAIEVDGPMHRNPIYGKERLEMQQYNDSIKDSECKRMGITLLRINTDDMDVDIEPIRKILSQAIRRQKSMIEGATHRQ